jgi:hypothetical protein
VTTRTPTAVADLEISTFVPPSVELNRHSAAQVILRLHGRPLGIVPASVRGGRLDADQLIRDILAGHGGALAAPLVDRALAIGATPLWPEVSPLLACRPNTLPCTPSVTVAIRAFGSARGEVRACVDAVNAADYPGVEVIVVDNEEVESRLLEQAGGEVLAVIDASVTIDRGWIGAMVRMLVADPDVAAVSGLVVPRETTMTLGAGVLQRSWHRGRHVTVRPAAGSPFATAFWRDALASYVAPGFSPAAAGMVAPGFSRAVETLLRAGHTVAYEPSALAWHPTRLAANFLADAAAPRRRVATRQIDLGKTLRSIDDAPRQDTLRLDVTWDGRAVGQIEIAHHGGIVSPFRIQDALGRALAFDVLDTKLQVGAPALRAILTSELARHLLARRATAARAADACPAWVESQPAAA